MRPRLTPLLLTLICSVGCDRTTAPRPTSVGVYLLTSVVIPSGDTIAIPGRLPRANNEDVFILSGSLTLDQYGDYEDIERDSVVCVTCGPNAYSLQTITWNGTYAVTDTLLTLSEFPPSSATLTNGVIHVRNAPYGAYEFRKQRS